MEQLAKMTGVLCISVVAMEIVYNLGHFPSVERSVRFITAVYIVLTALKTFGNTQFTIMPPVWDDSSAVHEYTQQFSDTVIEETENKAEEIIRRRLQEKNISYNQVSVHILEQNGLLTAEKIVIECEDSHKAAAEDCIQDFITEETVIITGE
ncbi:MAG: hypothetical protein IJO54_01860 [Oscillospiraceae bacterium]|nr:hypothetical protein [Oscillospiraceae bacterium]